MCCINFRASYLGHVNATKGTRKMHKAHVSKAFGWQMDVFKGLAINELFAQMYIKARISNSCEELEKVLKGIRVIHSY